MMAMGNRYLEPALPMVSTVGPWGLSAADLGSTAAPGSTSYESANRAVFFPIIVPAVTVIKRVWWANGATTTGGATIEVGVYSDAGYKPGTKLISGSATQGTASQVQFVDVTDTTISPGLYWLAVVSSSATSTTLFRTSSSSAFNAARWFIQASASPLPSSATPTESTTANAWLFGFSTTTIT